MSRLRNLGRLPIIIGIIVIVAAGGGGAAWALTRSSGSSNGTTQVVTAAIHTVRQTVSASGTIAPAHEADLDFGASGRVSHVKVKVGDHVHKGQTLATIGTASLAAQQAAAQAAVTADEEKVAADGGSSSTAADQAALVAARNQLTSATKALDAATLKSTITGTVTSVNLTVGQQVTAGADANSANSSSNSGSNAQVVVQSAHSFLVNATVDDTQVSQVKKGQSVSITPEGAITPVTGKVRSVGKVPTSSSGVVSFPVVVRVAGHPSGVYAGASATLTITTKRVPNVLEIPALAVTYNGSTATVQLQQGGSTTTRTITVGQTYGAEVQVLSGLAAGDKVVVTLPTLPNIVRNGNGNGNGNRTFQFPGGGGLFNNGGGGVIQNGGGGFPGNFNFGNGKG